MPKIHLDKSVIVNASPAKVFKIVSDFHNWRAWSPWMITDPSVELNVNNDGKYYDWKGDIIGTGNMTVLSEIENEQVDYNLTFLKPFKSKANVSFILKPEGENTRVHWTMDSSLPFFMFWMKKMMTVLIGMDYERGLSMLKEYSENDKVTSTLTFKGIQPFEACQFIGISTTCAMSTMPKAMSKDYTELMEFVMENHSEKISGKPFSVYHKWSPVKGEVEYQACVPVSQEIGNLPGRMKMGSIPATIVHSVLHEGPYRYAGNAWSSQYAMSRSKKFKANKKLNPMEIYHNSPTDTPEKELISEIVFPVVS